MGAQKEGCMNPLNRGIEEIDMINKSLAAIFEGRHKRSVLIRSGQIICLAGGYNLEWKLFYLEK